MVVVSALRLATMPPLGGENEMLISMCRRRLSEEAVERVPSRSAPSACGTAIATRALCSSPNDPHSVTPAA